MPRRPGPRGFRLSSGWRVLRARGGLLALAIPSAISCGLCFSCGSEKSSASSASSGAAPGSGAAPSSDGQTPSETDSVVGGSSGTDGREESSGGEQSGGGSGDAASGGASGAGASEGLYEYGERIEIDGRRILIGGAPLYIRGVCWNPVARGLEHPSGLDFAGASVVDIPLMKAAGINVVRTYEPLLDIDVLDLFAAAEIYVIQSVFPFGNDPSVVVERVNATKAHPAILMWAIGNEWNYNGFYADVPFDQAVLNIAQAARLIRESDPTRPIATIYGELPSQALIDQLVDIDVWGINAYRGISFGDLIEEFGQRANKPLFLSEFGADAWDARGQGEYNPAAQAEATSALLNELFEHSVAKSKDGVVSGGTIFEWADEWWKAGDPAAHDTGGNAPGGGPYPDGTFNEEWWGIVDIDRNPRPAYDVLKTFFATQSTSN